ncbi:hypothetical protein ALO43_101306 [Pseudomonas tremae]|uniref:Uncharacterized protein n=1 Tax=Pseudomonas tremae TaxID=200454 RepID=A0AA40P0S2_9PSED|nr:hypothetical protein ALO77_101338 [Pseudomonas coronafaciens pv. garcae]KPY22707.1 hypothetical protein ALO89_101644 [Pseudomonas coronafaciens pv. porri]KPY93383.1 hypothetical protein ALO43_101306 [Pseudomonas tremae]RMM37638.1 hypothetical protein ALQ80_01564 [Pseudomonas coronafaciens pv. oryzae]RMN36188.1 hypothetical protein ALQ61_100855 [Pseudomonas coronafaciens pv. zizaniae]RMN89787.1 hypothetical protein ALQ50_101293 [Pseudomonas coronafaciens pv. coronafaciens]
MALLFFQGLKILLSGFAPSYTNLVEHSVEIPTIVPTLCVGMPFRMFRVFFSL